MLKKPALRICLSHDEIKILRNECSEFILKARSECGVSISMEEILESRQQVKDEKLKFVELAAVKNMLEWKQQEESRAELIRKYREEQQEKLQSELQKIEESKLLKRMEEIENVRNNLEEMERIESADLLKENQEITERIKIYKELNQQLDKACMKQDEIIGDLNQKLREDILNANDKSASLELNNAIKDDMNNVITTTSTTVSDARKNKLKIMSHEYNMAVLQESDSKNGNKDASKPLSVAQKNKMKVMGHEFGKIDEAATQPIIKIQDYDKMTDLQRNRLKVMSHEFGSVDDPMPAKKSAAMNEMTDLQRNRLKILSHEYGIEKESAVDKEPKLRKLSLDLLQPEAKNQVPESPMSITSDHFSNTESNEKTPEDTNTSTNNSNNNNNDDSNNSSNNVNDDEVEIEMIKAFEDAIEKNRKTFMGINLNDSVKQVNDDNYAPSMDAISLSHLLQMSLTLPLNAYMSVLNNETLKMFIKELDILSHFKSLRNYFLLMNGEFGSSICSNIFTKLEKGIRPIDLLNYQSLHMMLDNALSGSQSYDPNTENLSFIVQNIPEKFELHSPSVLNMLTLSYKLEWPLTLILNPETMEQYRTIFNYLIKLKRINWILEECFQILKASHKLFGCELLKSQQYRNVQQIRHKMTHFIHCLENYVTRNVLQISWSNFIQDLKSAESILCIYRKHTNYLKRILFLCLLNKRSYEFYKSIEDVFKVILKFHKYDYIINYHNN
jgi:gamma-tubulin complex component 6